MPVSDEGEEQVRPTPVIDGATGVRPACENEGKGGWRTAALTVGCGFRVAKGSENPDSRAMPDALILFFATLLSTACVFLLITAIRLLVVARQRMAALNAHLGTVATLRNDLDTLDADVKALGKNHRRLRGAFYGQDGGRPRKDDDDDDDGPDKETYEAHRRALRM